MVILRFINLVKKEKWLRVVCREVYKYGVGFLVFLYRGEGVRIEERGRVKEGGF